MGRKAVDSNQLFIDGLEVPEEDRIGEEGRGFDYILHGLNPERMLVGAEAVGIGRAALERAASLRQGARRVRPPDRPEPGRSSIRSPSAGSSSRRRELADAAARPGDTTRACRAAPRRTPPNISPPRPAVKACETAMLTLGGYGYAKEFHVERYLREAMITRLAPVSPQLILCYIAERVLGLPKSY